MTDLRFPDRPVYPDWSVMFDGPPSRRISIRTDPNVVASFTALGTQTDAEALAEFRKFQERVITGHTRRIVCVDGPPAKPRQWIVWALKVARSYVDSWINRLALKTIRRAEVKAKLAELDAGIERHLANA